MPINTTSSGPTLTNVTYIGRQTVKFGSILLIFLIVGRMSFNAFVAWWKATHPPPPPPPTVGFGVLPTPNFTSADQPNKPVSYRLETATGGLPDFPDRAKVYFMPASTPSLLADERAKEIAATYGFVFEPEVLDSRNYRWTKSQPLLSTFGLDIQNYHFEFSTDYLSRPELLADSNLPTGFNAVTTTKTFLDRAKLLPDDIATASGEIVYLKALGGELQEAVSESDADFIQVDLNRTPIDGIYRMYTPEGFTGVISAIISGASNQSESIVAINNYYNPVDYTQMHTYPIRTSQAAWQVLQAGEGFVVESGSSDTAVVREVELGYYDDYQEQAYLQPIYVFTGDDGFMGYVPAVTGQFLQK